MADTEEHSYKFDVKMTCGGCSGAVTRALQKAQDNAKGTHFESVSSFDVSLDTQEVLVKGTIPYDDALAVIKKTGKEASVDGTL
ncbi:hypothetical protein BJV78DRAFT_1352320 [Lactifluus subvellereus]|nr:hypothetical protein BJV78DRAFT_1352320 [Lactifluus subvellereus]